MFSLAKIAETYWYPVTVQLAATEGGRQQKFTFEAEFKHLEQEVVSEMFRTREEGEPALKDAEVLDKVLVGWRDVQDAEGRPLAVNDENRALLLNIFPVPSSIVKAFLKSIGIEGKAKN